MLCGELYVRRLMLFNYKLYISITIIICIHVFVHCIFKSLGWSRDYSHLVQGGRKSFSKMDRTPIIREVPLVLGGRDPLVLGGRDPLVLRGYPQVLGRYPLKLGGGRVPLVLGGYPLVLGGQPLRLGFPPLISRENQKNMNNFFSTKNVEFLTSEYSL